VQAEEMLMGGVISLPVLVLSPDWCFLVLLYHISYQVSELTETETPIPVEVSGVEPDLNGLLY
jgi:hypothetical protein